MVRPSQLHRRDADAKDLLTFAAGQLLSETDKYAVSPCPGGRRTAAACERWPSISTGRTAMLHTPAVHPTTSNTTIPAVTWRRVESCDGTASESTVNCITSINSVHWPSWPQYHIRMLPHIRSQGEVITRAGRSLVPQPAKPHHCFGLKGKAPYLPFNFLRDSFVFTNFRWFQSLPYVVTWYSLRRGKERRKKSGERDRKQRKEKRTENDGGDTGEKMGGERGKGKGRFCRTTFRRFLLLSLDQFCVVTDVKPPYISCVTYYSNSCKFSSFVCSIDGNPYNALHARLVAACVGCSAAYMRRLTGCLLQLRKAEHVQYVWLLGLTLKNTHITRKRCGFRLFKFLYTFQILCIILMFPHSCSQSSSNP